ncbi:T9SS type A sorting domain-containing protein [Crocinitomix catalasitica]|uniref:T9SS type A sorting domain-containing protein n=1 Tax=Crocinitomix catalasitica TaxID=184607 RepID=UPI00056AB6C9|nr:T9SS type A sorting domain-containing protein [Crocinitomix catalasitica]
MKLKQLLFNATIGLLAFPAIGQTIYEEDFNDSDGGWTVTSGVDWEHGTPLSANINHEGNPCGGDAWVTNLDGDYTNSANAVVESPAIDCSGAIVDPILAFNLNYITESCCDEGWVEFSLDGGATWTKLIDDGDAIGWYNDLGNEWWDDSNDGWSVVSNVIPGAAGMADVRIRFHFSSDGSVGREGFGFDDIVVATFFQSLTMNGQTNINSGLVLTDSENIEISLTNNTATDLTDVEVCFVVNEELPVCELIPTVIPGENTYTFVGTADFSLVGDYEIFTYATALRFDPNQCDDSALVAIELYDPIAEFPYVENFEDVNAFDYSGVWEYGEPLEGSPFDNTLACPSDSMVMGTVIRGDYLNSITDYVYTPIFDFSSFIADPYVMFDLFRNTESCCDEAWMDVSVDGGLTWSRVGAEGSGFNWYNDAFNQWWDGESGGWVYAHHELTGLAGEENVRFRFAISTDGSVTRTGIAIDNFVIQESIPFIVDPATVSLTMESDYVLCGFSSVDYLVADFTNNGVDSLIGFTVCYDIGYGLICETLLDTILPGEIFTYTFGDIIDFTDAASHDIILTISSDDDFRSCELNSVFTLSTPLTHLSGTTTITDISCNGEADGDIFVNPQFGTPGYGVTWDSGDAGFILGDLAAGYHVYTITDANGCEYTDSAEVIEPDAITLTADAIDESELGNGAINLTVMGGTSPYTFDWDNDGTGDFDAQDLTNLDPGTYTVIVTDANGCTETLTISVGSVVGINTLNGTNVDIYPNPTNGLVNFALTGSDEIFNYTVTDIAGKTIGTQTNSITGNSILSIDLTDFESGLYLVKLFNESSEQTFRIVKN